MGDLHERVHRHSENVPSNERKRWLAKKPVKEWSVDLPSTKDFKERVEKITPPKDLTRNLLSFASHDLNLRNRKSS